MFFLAPSYATLAKVKATSHYTVVQRRHGSIFYCFNYHRCPQHAALIRATKMHFEKRSEQKFRHLRPLGKSGALHKKVILFNIEDFLRCPIENKMTSDPK